MKEKLLNVEENIVSLSKEKCRNCNSENLTLITNYLHKFDNQNYIDDVLLCNDCNCIHFLHNNRIMYEYLYKSNFDRKVDWKINNN